MRRLLRFGSGGLFFVLLALLASEAVLGALFGAPTLGMSDLQAQFIIPHPRRGYAFRPNSEITYDGVHTQLNSLGLRGEPPRFDQPLEVLALGDELTFGAGVADGETYPSRLQTLLRNECPSCGQVVNAGVPGYSSYEGLMLLRDLIGFLHPKIVFAALPPTGALSDATTAYLLSTAPKQGTMGDLRLWLLKESNLYALLRTMTRPATPPTANIKQALLNRHRRDLFAVVTESRRVGAVPVLLLIGARADAAGSRPAPSEYAALRVESAALVRDLAAQVGAPLVEFAGQDLDDVTMVDAIHPSAEGYRRIAARLRDATRDLLTAPGGEGPPPERSQLVPST